MEVVVGGIGVCLPAPARSDQMDASAPKVVPRGTVLFAQPIESEVRRDRGEADRLAMRLAVALAGNQRHHRPHHVHRSGTRPERVAGPERCGLVVLLAFLLHVLAALEARHVCRTARAESAMALPEERAIDGGLVRPRRVGLAFDVAARDVGLVHRDRDGELAVAVHADAQLVDDDGGLRPAAEDEVLGVGADPFHLVREARSELATGEVVALIDEPGALRVLAELHAVQRNVSGDRIRRPRESLDLVRRMYGRKPVHDRESLYERDAADPKADQPVGEIRGNVFRLVVGHRWRAYRLAHS